MGRLRLSSRDPRAGLHIQYNFFDDQNDLDRLVDAVRLSRKIGRTAPFSDLIDHEMAPGYMAKRHSVVLAALRSGGGRMAQFSHADFWLNVTVVAGHVDGRRHVQHPAQGQAGRIMYRHRGPFGFVGGGGRWAVCRFLSTSLPLPGRYVSTAALLKVFDMQLDAGGTHLLPSLE
jgi:hypothetical protein